jgi:hypothetical protein
MAETVARRGEAASNFSSIKGREHSPTSMRPATPRAWTTVPLMKCPACEKEVSDQAAWCKPPKKPKNPRGTIDGISASAGRSSQISSSPMCSDPQCTSAITPQLKGDCVHTVIVIANARAVPFLRSNIKTQLPCAFQRLRS